MISMPELKQTSHGMPSTESNGTQLMKALQAPNLAALRAMDPLKLTNEAAAAFFTPWVTVDGRFVPKQLVKTFDQGEQAHVPLLAGFNSGELRSLRILVPPAPANEADYVKIIRSRYGDLADKFLRLYPASDMQESILAATRDAMYGWTAEKMVRSQTAVGKSGYLYFFDHSYPAADQAGLHGFHASELPFVFGTLDGTPPKWPTIPDTPEQHKLSDAMLGYWSSFASTGKPVAKGEPDWPAFGSNQGYMAFTDAPHPSHELLPGAYQLTDEVVCRRLASGDQPWGWNVGVAAPPILPPPCSRTTPLLPARRSAGFAARHAWPAATAWGDAVRGRQTHARTSPRRRLRSALRGTGRCHSAHSNCPDAPPAVQPRSSRERRSRRGTGNAIPHRRR